MSAIVLDRVGYGAVRHGQRLQLLDEVTFSLQRGSRTAVLGHAGSGKTILLRLMAGILRPTSGAIEFGETVSFPIGFLGAPGTSTTAEFVDYVCRLYGSDARRIIDFLRLDIAERDLRTRPLMSLQPEERNFIGYVVGYSIPFGMYLVDRVIGVGSPRHREICERLFRMRAETSGFVLATRHVRLAQRYCEAGIVLENGQATYYPDLDEAIEIFQKLPIPYVRPLNPSDENDDSSDADA